MFYFSQLKNSKVVTEKGLHIGSLVDLIFQFKAPPKVTKLVVRSHLGRDILLIPIAALKKIDTSFILQGDYTTQELEENELFVSKNLVDKQIIDIEGRKVVRVNDVLFQPKKADTLYLAGVDTSLSGMMRWFGLENLYHFFAKWIGKGNPHILVWTNIQPLELSEGKVVLNRRQDRLQQFHPEDLADFLETTNIKNVIKTIGLLDREFASEVIAELNLNYQVELFNKIGTQKTTEILSLMDPDEAVDVLLQFPLKKRQSVLSQLSKEKQMELKELLQISQTGVGEYLTTEFVTARRDETVGALLGRIATSTAHIDFLDYVYIINRKDQLIGVCSLHELLVHPANTPIEKFMTPNVIVAHLTTPTRTVLKKLIKYKISTLPIVDKHKKIIGIVTIDDIGEIFIENI